MLLSEASNCMEYIIAVDWGDSLVWKRYSRLLLILEVRPFCNRSGCRWCDHFREWVFIEQLYTPETQIIR